MLAHERSCAISAVTRVIANTKTRSKNSSSGVTRCSDGSAGGVITDVTARGETARASGTYSTRQPASRRRRQKSTSSASSQSTAAAASRRTSSAGGRRPVDVADPRAVALDHEPAR